MIWNFFKKDNEEEDDTNIDDLVLSKLKPGYLVDYDMKTFKVMKRNLYVWEGGERTDEWELKQGEKSFFLEREEDDGEVEWTLSTKHELDVLEGDIANHIIEHEDPPEEVVMDGKTYYFEEDDIGEYYEGASNYPKEFVAWDYYDEEDQTFLSIEQWGETKFDLTLGFPVEEYQFSNILPGTL